MEFSWSCEGMSNIFGHILIVASVGGMRRGVKYDSFFLEVHELGVMWGLS